MCRMLLSLDVAKDAALHAARAKRGEGARPNECGTWRGTVSKSVSSQSAAVITSHRADRLQHAGGFCSPGELHKHPSAAVVPGTVQGAVGKPFLHQRKHAKQTCTCEGLRPRGFSAQTLKPACAVDRARILFLEFQLGRSRIHAVTLFCTTPGLQQASCSMPQHLIAKKHHP